MSRSRRHQRDGFSWDAKLLYRCHDGAFASSRYAQRNTISALVEIVPDNPRNAPEHNISNSVPPHGELLEGILSATDNERCCPKPGWQQERKPGGFKGLPSVGQPRAVSDEENQRSIFADEEAADAGLELPKSNEAILIRAAML